MKKFFYFIFIILNIICINNIIFAKTPEISTSTTRSSVSNHKPYYWSADQKVYERDNSESDGSADSEYADDVWVKSGSQWWFWQSGWISDGQYEVDDKQYYFKNAVMQTNVTIDGWQYGSDGVGKEVEEQDDNTDDSELNDEIDDNSDESNGGESGGLKNITPSGPGGKNIGTNDSNTYQGVTSVSGINPTILFKDIDDINNGGEGRFGWVGLYMLAGSEPGGVLNYVGNLQFLTQQSQIDAFKQHIGDYTHYNLDAWEEWIKFLLEEYNISLYKPTDPSSFKERTAEAEARTQLANIVQINSSLGTATIIFRIIGVFSLVFGFLIIVCGAIDELGIMEKMLLSRVTFNRINKPCNKYLFMPSVGPTSLPSPGRVNLSLTNSIKSFLPTT